MLDVVEEASIASLNMSITPPARADVGDLVYIPISVTNILTSSDLHGAQIGVQVNNTSVLTPASNLMPRMGGLFATNSLTYSVALTNGWGFMLTSTVSPTVAISGSGVIVEFPFYARAEGCVTLDFTDHLLTNSNAQLIDHQITAGQMCVWDKGNLKGTSYLQSRTSGYFTGTVVVLSGTRGTYTTTADAGGSFTFTNIYSDSYTATFTHPLFVRAVRPAITATGQTTATMSEVGLWAGDMNQDGNVNAPDWYLCAAASIPVDDPAFDINSDQATDIRDCTLLGGNIGRPNMSATNPPKTALATSAQGIHRPAASSGIGRIVSVPLGNGDTVLRAIEVNGQIYATGTRLSLPAGSTVTQVELRDGFAGGFLNWHQTTDSLYIVTAPRQDISLTRDTDIAFIHITAGGEPTIAASSSVGQPSPPHLIFLPLVRRS